MVTSLSCDCPSQQYYSVLRVKLILLCNLGPKRNSNTNSNVQPSYLYCWSWNCHRTDQDLISTLPDPLFCSPLLSLIISIEYHKHHSLTTLIILVASTRHAHLTTCVSLRLAKRPSAQFANSQTRFKNSRTPFKHRSATALHKFKQGY